MYVRMHRLDCFRSCVFVINGISHLMEMHVHGDNRRHTTVDDHVVVKGDFEYLKQLHSVPHNCWLQFNLDQHARYHEHKLVFNVR